jgi:3-oxoacyl-[acyl-carrier protein] reductase
MLLEDRNAVIYGGGGAIGGAVARAFAREGATVFLAGRTQEPLDAVAGEIRGAGGSAETAVVDALDERAVEEHADAIVDSAGSIDASLNVITHPFTHGKPLIEQELGEFEPPYTVALRSNFITTRAAGRRMAKQDSGGVILFFGGSGEPMRDYYIGATQIAFEALESLRRQLAAELGPHGVRAVSLQTGGIPEAMPDIPARDEIVEPMVAATMIGRAATLEDVGNAAVFAASRWGRTLTGTKLNITCGTFTD